MADVITLHKPEAGENLSITATRDSSIELGFAPEESTLSRAGEALVFSFEDGGSIEIAGFYAAVTKEALPDFIIQGQVVAGADFFAALDDSLMPAAGNAAATASQGGYPKDITLDALLGGLDALGGLDYGFALSARPETTLLADGEPEATGGALTTAAATSTETLTGSLTGTVPPSGNAPGSAPPSSPPSSPEPEARPESPAGPAPDNPVTPETPNTPEEPVTPPVPPKPVTAPTIDLAPIVVGDDNVIDPSEVNSLVTLNGTVGGDVKAGDTVILTLGTQEIGRVLVQDMDGHLIFSTTVDAKTLYGDPASRETASVTASVTTASGTATDTESYVVTTDMPPKFDPASDYTFDVKATGVHGGDHGNEAHQRDSFDKTTNGTTSHHPLMVDGTDNASVHSGDAQRYDSRVEGKLQITVTDPEATSLAFSVSTAFGVKPFAVNGAPVSSPATVLTGTHFAHDGQSTGYEQMMAHYKGLYDSGDANIAAFSYKDVDGKTSQFYLPKALCTGNDYDDGVGFLVSHRYPIAGGTGYNWLGYDMEDMNFLVTDYGVLVYSNTDSISGDGSGSNNQFRFFLDSGAEAVRELSEDQLLQLDFRLTVTDAAGNPNDQILTLNLYGSNDAPVLSLHNGHLVVADPDSTDTHVFGIRDHEGQLHFDGKVHDPAGSLMGTLEEQADGTYAFVLNPEYLPACDLTHTISVLVRDSHGALSNALDLTLTLEGSEATMTLPTMADDAMPDGAVMAAFAAHAAHVAEFGGLFSEGQSDAILFGMEDMTGFFEPVASATASSVVHDGGLQAAGLADAQVFAEIGGDGSETDAAALKALLDHGA